MKFCFLLFCLNLSLKLGVLNLNVDLNKEHSTKCSNRLSSNSRPKAHSFQHLQMWYKHKEKNFPPIHPNALWSVGNGKVYSNGGVWVCYKGEGVQAASAGLVFHKMIQEAKRDHLAYFPYNRINLFSISKWT